MTIKTILSKLNSFVNQKRKNLLFCVISVLPPNIFMFRWYIEHAELLYYWHIFIVATMFSMATVIFYWVISRIGKSSQGSAFTCVFLWIMFFYIKLLHEKFIYDVIANFNRTIRLLTLAILVLFLTVLVFYIGRRLKHREIFKILAVFEITVFLVVFTQAIVVYVSGSISRDSKITYKTSFNIEADSPSPNIYWLFMDGMLGFKAMEYFFDDPQIEFETQLKERGFLVNRDAEFEAFHGTIYAIPALMSPEFYDKVMSPLLISYDPASREYLLSSISETVFDIARTNNELITAFNAKSYQTNGLMVFFWHHFPMKFNSFYVKNRKIENRFLNSTNDNYDKAEYLFLFFMEKTPFSLFSENILYFYGAITKKEWKIKFVEKSDFDMNTIYGNLYSGNGISGNDTWNINALIEIFESPQPRMTIIHDLKAHVPYILAEDGSVLSRTKNEKTDIYNYPPQHRFTRNYLIALVDLIIANDPDAVIVVQADHGLHNSSPEQILSSGGTEEEVRLIYNQTMSAVRIPDKWGGLDAPLDPLNITRVLVNRYVGQNYELLEDHP